MQIYNSSFKARGFTLIELLVVIAIIGILAGIVLASLGTARTSAGDAKTREQLNSLRTAMETYYSTNGNYGSATNACSGGAFANASISSLVSSTNYPSGTTFKCGATSATAAWAVEASLGGGGFFCVDSNGTAT